MIPTKITDLFAHAPEARYEGVVAQSRYLTMRDGVRIAIDVLLPADLPAGVRLPTLMIMARYWRSMDLHIPSPPKRAPIAPRESTADYFVARGFAVVVVDARGTGASFGVCRYPWAAEELEDYGEVVRWIGAQAWSNGNVGAYGISYEGATAQRLIARASDALKGVIPQQIEYDVYADVALPGGVFNEVFIRTWSESNNRLDSNRTSDLFPFLARFVVKGVRPVDADRLKGEQLRAAVAEHQANTDVFHAMSDIVYRDDLFGETGVTLDDFSVFAHNSAFEQRGVPMFTWASWLDGASADAALRNLNTYNSPQIVVIGGWKHEMTAHASPYAAKPGGKPTPTQAEQWAAMAQFFQQTLNLEQPPTGKSLFYYTLGEETWKHTTQFPLPNVTPQRWHFVAGGELSREQPILPATDTYQVDFDASTGITNRWHTQFAKPLNYPNRANADRRLLTYTSAPLTVDTEITGHPVVSLYVASTEPDGAFFVYLEDVDPHGVVRYITEGQLRAIHRRLSDTPPPYWTVTPHRTFKRADAAPLPIGETVLLQFALLPTSVLIRRGHRIRVALAGADKGTFGRVPSTGAPCWSISCGSAGFSHIELPIVPR